MFMADQGGVLSTGILIFPWAWDSEAGVLAGTGDILIIGIIHITLGAHHVIIADITDMGDITLIGIMDTEIIIMAVDQDFLQIMVPETGI